MDILCQPIHPHQTIHSPTAGQTLGEEPGAGPCGQALLISGVHCRWSRALPRALWSVALSLLYPSLVRGSEHQPRLAVQLVEKRTLY